MLRFARDTNVLTDAASASTMSPTLAAPETEAALTTFLETVPSPDALPLRTLAHAWTGGGGALAVGKVAVRLLGDGFTAGTLHARDGPARLELCRVLLEKHGVDADQWTHWSDEFADLAHHGFDHRAKYPSLPIAHLSPAELARLVSGLRDLASMTS